MGSFTSLVARLSQRKAPMKLLEEPFALIQPLGNGPSQCREPAGEALRPHQGSIKPSRIPARSEAV